MLRRPLRAVAMVVPLTWVVGAAACGSSSSDTARPAPTSSATSTPTSLITSGSSGSTAAIPATAAGHVDIVDYDFAPNTITVKVGDTVTWTNRDTSDHWVVSSPSSPSTFDLGRQSTGATVNFTFGAPGSYPYFCNLHNYMKGTVVVS